MASRSLDMTLCITALFRASATIPAPASRIVSMGKRGDERGLGRSRQGAREGPGRPSMQSLMTTSDPDRSEPRSKTMRDGKYILGRLPERETHPFQNG